MGYLLLSFSLYYVATPLFSYKRVRYSSLQKADPFRSQTDRVFPIIGPVELSFNKCCVVRLIQLHPCEGTVSSFIILGTFTWSSSIQNYQRRKLVRSQANLGEIFITTWEGGRKIVNPVMTELSRLLKCLDSVEDIDHTFAVEQFFATPKEKKKWG